MADAWTTLLVHSTLSSGDAWEHLNAQEGGDGGPVRCYGAKEGLHFNLTPATKNFGLSSGGYTFHISPHNLVFDARQNKTTIKLKSVDYTFNFKRVYL